MGKSELWNTENTATLALEPSLQGSSAADQQHDFLLPVPQVHYWQREQQNQTEKVQVVFVPETSLRLGNLTSYTAHLLTLTAFTKAGDGPASEPQGARTLQTGRARARTLQTGRTGD